MIVRHKGMTFRCRVEAVGFTFAKPVIEVEQPWLLWTRWRKWSKDAVVEGVDRLHNVERMLPDALEAWFVTAIERQLKYNEAWMLHNMRSAG